MVGRLLFEIYPYDNCCAVVVLLVCARIKNGAHCTAAQKGHIFYTFFSFLFSPPLSGLLQTKAFLWGLRSSYTIRRFGVSQNWGYHFGGSYDKDYHSILGFILGPPT